MKKPSLKSKSNRRRKNREWIKSGMNDQTRPDPTRPDPTSPPSGERVEARFRSPIRRPGGKFRQAKMLVGLIAKVPHICYVEPFCGAAHVFFAKPPSKIEVLNDLDGELMNFFRCAQTVPEAVARAVAAMPHARRLQRLLKTAPLDLFDPIQRAVRFLWLVHHSFGGDPNNGFAYSRAQSGGARKRASAIAQSLRGLQDRLDAVILECLDWRGILKTYDAPTTLFYLDPPYLGADLGYQHDLTEQDHRDLAGALKQSNSKWLLTVGDIPIMRQLYQGYTIRQISTPQSLKKGLRGRFGELIIRNY